MALATISQDAAAIHNSHDTDPVVLTTDDLFDNFVGVLFRELGEVEQDPVGREEPIRMASFTLNDIDFVIALNKMVDDQTIMASCRFGSLPTENRTLILERLFEMNAFIFNDGGGVFALDGAGDIIYLLRWPIDFAEPGALGRVLNHLSRQALAWRNGYFIEDESGVDETRYKLTTIKI